VGEHVRTKISDRRTRKQIQSASKQGKPTVLLIFNNLDPAQLFGTENHDFEHAMYGEHTVVIDRNSGKIVGSFRGQQVISTIQEHVVQVTVHVPFRKTKDPSFSAAKSCA
jgi:hypothetical protein